MRPRVAVASEHPLVGEAVVAALDGVGFSVTSLAWPPRDLPVPHPRADEPPEVGLLVCDLDLWQGVATSGEVLHHLPVPWVVLTGAPVGPMWGAAYEEGAAVVLPSTTQLEEVAATLTVVAGRGRPVADAERDRLQAQWRTLRTERDRMSDRAHSLTRREHEVLVLLYDGATILEIAALFRVSPSTVRSQMKSIRRKLGVTSQLGAVAAYGAVIRTEPQTPVRSCTAAGSSPDPR